MQKNCPTHVSREALAGVLGLLPTSVSRLVQHGVLTRDDRGFPLGPNIRSYVAHAAESERRRTSGSAAGTALAERKIAAIEAQWAREDSNLIEMREVLEFLDEMNEMIEASLDEMPKRGVLPPQAVEIFQEDKQRFREGAARIRAELISSSNDMIEGDA